MAHAGQELEGPNGYRLRLLAIEPERLEMEASYSGEGGFPPEHMHPNQTERFEVLDGTMVVRVGDEERRYAAGETFEVPAGTAHTMTGDGPTRMRWEVRPALRTAEFFEALYGGAIDDFTAFLADFADEFRLTGT